jgi:hypothetical protein
MSFRSSAFSAVTFFIPLLFIPLLSGMSLEPAHSSQHYFHCIHQGSMKNDENAEVEASGKQEAREEAVGTEELAGSGARGKDEVSVEEFASDGDLLEALQTLMKNDFIVQHGNETTGAAKVCNLTMHKLNVQNVLPGVAVELGLTIAKVRARFFDAAVPVPPV